MESAKPPPMARIDNPFSLFEVDDDEVDPVALLARAEAKRISEASAAATEQDLQPPQPEKKDDAGGTTPLLCSFVLFFFPYFPPPLWPYVLACSCVLVRSVEAVAYLGLVFDVY